MTDAPKYLSGKSTGAWAHPPRKTPTPPNRQDTAPVATLICLCLCTLAVLGATAWGWSMVNVYIADQIEVGVTRD